MAEKLCLNWDEFQEKTINAFKSFRNDSDFTDVTLACEGGQQVEALRVLLAASSPFFKNLFKNNKHPHPLIYMKGVRLETLEAIVDFLYSGKANIYREHIDAFFSLAQDLDLPGLNVKQEEKMLHEPCVIDQAMAPPNEETINETNRNLQNPLDKHEEE